MPVIPANTLRHFTATLLATGGFSPSHANETADLLVWANLRGVESHGVLRVPRYLEMVEKGLVVGDAVPVLAHAFGAVATLDGGRCPGAVGMNAAVREAARRAGDHGLGWCAIRNTSHCGAIGYFTGALAARGLVGIGMSASKPLMSYYGAKGEALSTNPLSIAAPTRSGAPVVLDMSTAAVALGKVMAAKDAGRDIPEGWAIDADGNPATDPAKVAALLPVAGPKGSGLSLMIEVLTSVLPGSPVIGPVLAGTGKSAFNGAVAALDPAAFGDVDQFLDDMDQLADVIHGLEPVAGGGDVLLPGERGAQTQAQRERDGIPLADGTAKRLVALARELECEVPGELTR